MTREDQSPEPIDADYTPSASAARPESAHAAAKGPAANSVGYGALVVAAVAAALAGGAIGVVAGGRNGIDSAAFAPAEVRVDIDRIAVAQKDLADRQLMLRGELADLQARGASAADLGRVEAGLGQAVRDLSVLRADIDALGAGSVDGLAQNPSETAPEENTSPQTGAAGAARLVARLDMLEARIVSLEGLDARISALEARRAAYPSGTNGQTLAVRPTNGSTGQVQAGNNSGVGAKPVAPVSASLYQAPEGSGKAGQALETLSQAIELGQPVLPAARTLAAALPRNPDAAALVALAGEGVASLASLRRDFEAARQGPVTKPVVTNWWDRMLSGVVVVRRPAPGLRGPAINEAAAALDRGNIAAAIAAVDRLPVELRPGFARWRQAAQRRADAQVHMDAIAKTLAPG